MSDPAVPYDWTSIEKRAQTLLRKRMEVEARRSAEQERRKTLLSQAMAAQSRLDAAQSVQEILEDVQRQAHEHAVGAYEEMLSALLADVLPGERDVVLDLHADRGVSGMDVFIRKGEDQPLEDAWLGTGGSVTNLLSTGLRLVALMRSGRRRFMILDESDCWIKPELVGKYAGVVTQMSQELGVQVLMISHHDESLFVDHIPYRLAMTKLGSTINVEWTAESEVPSWDPQQEGLRSIGLFDFQSHQNTVVPLAPAVTLLQGDNDIGKSAVVNALRAVFDGNSNDTMIRHHAARSRVEVDLGDKLLTWVRNRKGRVKVSYDLTDAKTGQTIHSSVGTQPPEWLLANIGIGKVDELDIQIGQQQDPVFLLNQPASKRAKALAVGQESGHIQAMMALDRQEQQLARSTLKQCEQEIEILRLSELASRAIEQSSGPDASELERARGRRDDINKHLSLRDQWRAAEVIAGAGRLPKDKPKAPILHGSMAAQLLGQWSDFESQARVLGKLGEGVKLPPLPTDRATPLAHLAQQWKCAEKTRGSCSDLERPGPPEEKPVPKAPAMELLRTTWRHTKWQLDALGLLAGSKPPSPPVRSPKDAEIIHKEWGRTQAIHSVLSDLRGKALNVSIPLGRAGEMDEYRLRWEEAINSIETIRQDIVQIEKNQADTKEELASSFPVCPTCGQDIPEHTHPN